MAIIVSIKVDKNMIKRHLFWVLITSLLDTVPEI